MTSPGTPTSRSRCSESAGESARRINRHVDRQPRLLRSLRGSPAQEQAATCAIAPCASIVNLRRAADRQFNRASAILVEQVGMTTARRDRSDGPPSPPCAGCCTRGRRRGPGTSRRSGRRARTRRNRRGQNRGRGCHNRGGGETHAPPIPAPTTRHRDRRGIGRAGSRPRVAALGIRVGSTRCRPPLTRSTMPIDAIA